MSGGPFISNNTKSSILTLPCWNDDPVFSFFFFPRILCYFSFFFFIFQFYVGSINLQFYTIYSPLMYEFKFFEHSCASCHAIVLIFIFHYEFILSLTWSPVWSPMLCVSNIALPFLLVFIRIRDIVPCS